MPKIADVPNYNPAVDLLDKSLAMLLDGINAKKLLIVQIEGEIANAETVAVSLNAAAEALRPAPVGTVVQ